MITWLLTVRIRHFSPLSNCSNIYFCSSSNKLKLDKNCTVKEVEVTLSSRIWTLELLSLKAKLVSKVFDQMEAIEYNKLNHIIKELIKIKTKTTRTTVIKCLVGFFSNESQFRQSEEIEDAILGVINLFIRQTQVEAEFGKTVLTIFGKAWATKKY